MRMQTMQGLSAAAGFEVGGGACAGACVPGMWSAMGLAQGGVVVLEAAEAEELWQA